MENKQFYIKVNGQKVGVTEEVYRAYVRPVTALQRRKRRESRCLVKGKRYGLVRCKEDCGKCPYYSAGNKLLGGVLSLDALCEAGYDGVSEEDIEGELSEQEENIGRTAALHKAIGQLTERQKEMVRMVYFEGKTQEEVAVRYGVGKQAVSNAMQRIYAALRRSLEKNEKINF